MKISTRRTLLQAGLFAATSVALSMPALAQNSQPVRLVVGYAAGGPADQAARLFSTALGKALNASVVVENKGGANGTLAASEVVRAKPDGMTIWFAASATPTVAPHLMKLPFDMAKDLTPLGPVARYYNMLVANNNQPFSNAKELVDYATAKPHQVSYGSSGVGSSNHLAAALLAQKANIQLNHIPYKGNAPAMTDAMGGQLSMIFDIISTASNYVETGKLKAIAVGSPTRSPLLPNVPTFREAGIEGLKDYEAGGWYGIYAPKGMSAELTQKLVDAVKAAVNDETLKKRYAELGYDQWVGTPADLADTAAKDRAQWGGLLSGMTIN